MPNISTAIITMIRQLAICFGAMVLLMSLPAVAYAGMVRDTELESGLQQLMAPLLEAADYPPNSIAIRIIINPDYNAFVAGKKIIYLNSGLILSAGSTEEIIGVIAHEIGHIKATRSDNRGNTGFACSFKSGWPGAQRAAA